MFEAAMEIGAFGINQEGSRCKRNGSLDNSV